MISVSKNFWRKGGKLEMAIMAWVKKDHWLGVEWQSMKNGINEVFDYRDLRLPSCQVQVIDFNILKEDSTSGLA